MAEQPSLHDAEQVINRLYSGNNSVSRDTIHEATAKATIDPDLMRFFDHLPQGSYTRDQLVHTINDMIQRAGREKVVGQLH